MNFSNFNIKLHGVGVFPNENYIKVIWVSLNPKEEVIGLQQKIDSELLNLFPKDQRFSAHMTFGRVKFISTYTQVLKLLCYNLCIFIIFKLIIKFFAIIF